jgi:hypothetical protein
VTRARDEGGQVTAFVVIIVVALLALGGLVIDGGNALAAKRRAIDDADGAARAGAQALDPARYRTSGALEPVAPRAEQAALAYLSRAGHNGEVHVDGDQIIVTVVIDQPTSLLRIVGVRSMSVTGTGRARLIQGVAQGGS